MLGQFGKNGYVNCDISKVSLDCVSSLILFTWPPDCAMAFSMRSSSYVVASSLRTWHQVYTIHQNRYTLALQHHQARVQYNVLVMWRIQLRAKLRLLKHARIVEKFFIQRRTLKLWRSKLEMKKRLEKLKALEIQKLQVYMMSMDFSLLHTFHDRSYFSLAWKRKAIRRQSLRSAEQQIAERVNTVSTFSWNYLASIYPIVSD